MKLVFMRFVFLLSAMISIILIINMYDLTGFDLLYQFLIMCISIFNCANFYEYMDFNHPSKPQVKK